MRRHEKEIKDPEAIRDVLRRAQVCHLGLCDGDQPYVVPMNFGFEGNALYFHCASEGHKLDILRRNNRVCFQVETDVALVLADQACRCGSKFRCVIGFGRAVFIEALAEKRRALAIIMSHYASGNCVFPDATVARTCVFRVDVERVTGKQAGY